MSLGKGRTTELHKITADRKTRKIQQFDKADFRIANSFSAIPLSLWTFLAAFCEMLDTMPSLLRRVLPAMSALSLAMSGGGPAVVLDPDSKTRSLFFLQLFSG